MVTAEEELQQTPEDPAVDPGVSDLVQALPFRDVTEDDLSESLSIEDAVGMEDRRTEAF